MTELNRTWLIQRLNKPYGGKGIFKDNPFSFGGGLINGGLSKEAMDLLRPIFSFDYMGSAEFEFGAVPKSLDHIIKNIKEYNARTIKIAKQPVYVIAPAALSEKIDELLNQLAKDKIHCKESVNFDSALGLDKYFPKEKCNTIGWLELDNHFMFFVDETAYKSVAILFGLLQPETPAAEEKK